jgi:hypothetical protein
MKLLKYRRLMLMLISFALIFAFGVMTSVAQETVKLKDKRYLFITKMEVMKIDDTEGHIMQITETKGVDVGSGNVSFSRSFWDVAKGNGTVQGYTTVMDPDVVNVRFLKTQGKVTTTLSPAGKPITTMEGTFSHIKGTGKWEGFQGDGTWKLKMIGEGISVMDWECEVTKK